MPPLIMVLFEIADSHIKYMLVKGLILFPGSAGDPA